MSQVAPDTARVAVLRQWSAKAARLIDARVGDARAHAWNAVTQRVVAAPDGRETWRQAVLTRSYQAAVSRLDELKDEMVGPATTSLSGLVRDARAAFYVASFAIMRPTIPDELLATNPTPTKAGERAARGMSIHGYDLRSEVADLFASAESGLLAAVTTAGGRQATDAQARSILDGWEAQKVHAIRQRVDGLLSDSSVAILYLVGREMVDPKFHAED